ncbi:MAG TPA: hypothetical protein VHO90_21735 [Bacteroidales bacterium]|nr:hypothetical protein [Bacteroidales bacterium]
MLAKLKTIVAVIFITCSMQAQDSLQNSSFSLNADLVSRYVWRGQLYSAAPNIQPYASFTKGQFTVGTWGSYAIGENYSEVDFYVSWQYKNFGLSLNDYCTLSEVPGESDYFNLKDTSTLHSVEAVATFQISENFPLTLTAAAFFYGADRDDSGDKYYSSYFELSYPLSTREYEFNFFMGATPSEGLYGDKAGFVNVGLSAQKSIKMSDSFQLPAKVQLAANPLAKSMYIVFSLTI